jgi:hypothetical protein
MERMTRGQAMSLAKQIAEALEAADELIEKYGEDRTDGTVIRFVKRFPSRVMSNAEWFALWHERGVTPSQALEGPAPLREYHYASIRFAGQWYLTSGRNPKIRSPLSWEELLDWMDEGIPVDKIEFWPPAGSAQLVVTLPQEDPQPGHCKFCGKKLEADGPPEFCSPTHQVLWERGRPEGGYSYEKRDAGLTYEKFQDYRSLLGKQVRATFDEEGPVVSGKLLSIGDDGEFVIQDDTGTIHTAWPALSITEVVE